MKKIFYILVFLTGLVGNTFTKADGFYIGADLGRENFLFKRKTEVYHLNWMGMEVGGNKTNILNKFHRSILIGHRFYFFNADIYLDGEFFCNLTPFKHKLDFRFNGSLSEVDFKRHDDYGFIIRGGKFISEEKYESIPSKTYAFFNAGIEASNYSFSFSEKGVNGLLQKEAKSHFRNHSYIFGIGISKCIRNLEISLGYNFHLHPNIEKKEQLFPALHLINKVRNFNIHRITVGIKYFF